MQLRKKEFDLLLVNGRKLYFIEFTIFIVLILKLNSIVKQNIKIILQI